MWIALGLAFFLVLFFEGETRYLIMGNHKENLSKHDYIYGSVKMSIDMALTTLIIVLIILWIIQCLMTLFGDGDGGMDCDPTSCTCCDPHTVDMLCMHGQCHCDCVCGENRRVEHVRRRNYEAYKKK